MHTDLRGACKNARAGIRVPSVPLTTIVESAERRALPANARRHRSVFAALAAASILAPAGGAAVLHGAYVRLAPAGTVQISYDRRPSEKRNLTPAEVRSIARNLDFPAVLPSGLPEGTKLASVTRPGAGVLVLQYDLPGTWRRDNHVATFILANPRAVSTLKAPAHGTYQVVLAGGRGATRWNVGHESVIVLSSTLTSGELAHVKRAMMSDARPERPGRR